MTVTATITSKGQITLPKSVRKVLNTTTVEITVAGETVILKPVRSVAGVLATYAGRADAFSEVRERVWEEVTHDRKR